MGILQSLFSGKDVVGVFEIDHYDNGDIVLRSTVTPSFSYVAYAFYFDRLVFNSGDLLGQRLFRSIKALAVEAFTKVVQADGDVPLEDQEYLPSYPLASTVVPRSAGRVDLHVKAELRRRGHQCFMNTEFTPESFSDTERVAREGCQALFVHLYNAGDKNTKFFMPVLVNKQCEWYEQNGVPSITQITAAPMAGIEAVYQISSSSS